MTQNWFNLSVEETKNSLKTDIGKGLSLNEVSKRQEEYGLNELKAKKKKSCLLYTSAIWMRVLYCFKQIIQ